MFSHEDHAGYLACGCGYCDKHFRTSPARHCAHESARRWTQRLAHSARPQYARPHPGTLKPVQCRGPDGIHARKLHPDIAGLSVRPLICQADSSVPRKLRSRDPPHADLAPISARKSSPDFTLSESAGPPAYRDDHVKKAVLVIVRADDSSAVVIPLARVPVAAM